MMLGDFNMDHSHRQLSAFVEHYNFYNLIKANIKCDGSYIDLLLASRKYWFKNKSSFESGIEKSKKLSITVIKSFNGKPVRKN